MGKWDRRNYARPRRRYYQDYNWSPPRDEPCPDPETEVWQDNVPMWEKKFCYLVGRMPWKKVLSTRNFMTGNSNVLSWDDSAGKEAFFTAKKRFWEEFNGLPCETELPDPDMYIDQIDWNPYIDPDLVKEADQEYFNPDDKYHLPSTTRSNKNVGWPDDVDDPWECGYVQGGAEKNKASGWNQWDNNSVNGASKSNKDVDPWESHITHDNGYGFVQDGAEKNKASGWNQWDNNSVNGASKSNKDVDPWESHITHDDGVTKDEPTGWKEWDSSVNHSSKMNNGSDPWENHKTHGNKVVTGNTWGAEWNKSWDAKPKMYTDMSYNGSADGSSWRKQGSGWKDRGANSRSWNHPKGEASTTSYWSEKNRPQQYGSQQGGRMPNHRGGHWGQKPRDKYSWGPKDSINIHRNQGQLNSGCRKRGSPDYYVANQNGPRLQGDGRPTNYWDRGNNKRVSFGGQWS